MRLATILGLCLIGACVQAQSSTITSAVSTSSSSASSTEIVTAYIYAGNDVFGDMKFDGSVINADASSTTYNLTCTAQCGGLDQFVVTVAGTSSFHYTHSNVDGSGTSFLETADCTMFPTTSVSCSTTVTLAGPDMSSTSAYPLSYAASQSTRLPRTTILITAGADKLPTLPQTSFSAGSSSVSTGSASASHTPNAATRATLLSPIIEKSVLVSLTGASAIALLFAILL